MYFRGKQVHEFTHTRQNSQHPDRGIIATFRVHKYVPRIYPFAEAMPTWAPAFLHPVYSGVLYVNV